jgi:hypothetical protein
MRRAIIPLAAVLGLQLILAAVLLTRRDPLAATGSDTPLIPAAAVNAADQLIIEGKPAAPGAANDSARVALLKRDGAWVLPEAFNAPADGSRVNALLDRLAALKRGLPVASSEAALRRFKVVDADFERKLVLSAGGKPISTVYLGRSPGARKSDARTEKDHAVYAVDLPTYELPTDPSAWLKPDLLRLEVDKLAELDVSSAAQDKVRLLRQKAADGQQGGWTDPTLTADKQIDPAHAEALARDLAQVHVEAVLGTQPKPEWQQDHPLLTLKLQDDKAHSIDWTLSKPSSGDYYVLKSTEHPWYFSISAALGKQIIDASGRDALIVTAKPPGKASGRS